MTSQKSERNPKVSLRSGMYCHFFPEYLLINSNQKGILDLDKIKIHKTRDLKKIRLTLNVLYTLIFVSACFYTGFYPLILLLFVSLYDLRQLKRYYLPINRSKVIPIKNITHFEIGKGGLDLNYLYVFIQFEGKKSMLPLKLYDSENTLLNAIALAEQTGKKVIRPNEPKSIKGPYYPVNENSGYVVDQGKAYFIEHGQYKPDRIDNYQYLRVLAWVLILIGIVAILVKIDLVTQRPFRTVDGAVFLLLMGLLSIPYAYLFKALPNEFELTCVGRVKETSKKYILILREGKFPKKVHFSKKWAIPETLNLGAK